MYCVWNFLWQLILKFNVSGIAKHIAASGYGVYAIDHPGFGLSGGLHGYVASFDGIVDNVIEQYKIMKGKPVSHFNLIWPYKH